MSSGQTTRFVRRESSLVIGSPKTGSAHSKGQRGCELERELPASRIAHSKLGQDRQAIGAISSLGMPTKEWLARLPVNKLPDVRLDGDADRVSSRPRP
jgi:hypothetical protein